MEGLSVINLSEIAFKTHEDYPLMNEYEQCWLHLPTVPEGSSLVSRVTSWLKACGQHIWCFIYLYQHIGDSPLVLLPPLLLDTHP